MKFRRGGGPITTPSTRQEPASGSRIAGTRDGEPFQLLDFRVEPGQGRLCRDGDEVRITPRSMEVLLALVARAGKVMSRDEIFDRVWKDVIVGDEALTRCIADLRRAFGDTPADPRYIRTIPKKGYCLIPCPVPAAPEAGGFRPLSGRAGASRLSWRNILVASVVVLAALLAAGYSSLDRPPPAPAPVESIPLTSFPGVERDPEVSPDGTRVAYARLLEEANLDVFVQEVASGAVVRITDSEAAEYSPTWSPDGRSLAFLRRDGNGCRVRIRSLLGDGERDLASCGDNPTADLTWSPSGEWLALTDRESERDPYGIYLVSAGSGRRQLLVAPKGEHWGDKVPAFSPDGTRIAYIRSLGLGAQDLFTIPVSGGTPSRVTRDFEFLGGHTWSSDGRSLLFSSLRGGQWRLWTVPAAGGEPQWLPVTSHHPKSPHLSSSLLVFEDMEEDFDLVSFDLRQGSGSASRLIDSTRYEGFPQVSPSGEQLVFVSDRSGSRELWLQKGEELKQLTGLKGTFTGPPRWYPDEKSILFDHRNSSRSHLYRLDLADERLTRLTSSGSNHLFPTFSRDGRWIYFGSDRDGRWQVWRMPASGGEASRVTRNGAYAGQESGDGRFLYFTKFNQAGLWRMPLEGGEEIFIAESSGLTDRTHWVSHRRGLYFIFQEEGRIRLGRIPAVGAPRETLLELRPRLPGPGMSLTADAQRLFVSELQHREQDLLAVRLPPRP